MKTGSPRPKPGNPPELCHFSLQSFSEHESRFLQSPGKATLTELACPTGSTLSAVVPHWFDTPASTSRLSARPLPSSRLQLPEKSRKTPLLDFASPSELASMPGLSRFPSTESGGDEQAPLMGFVSPSALEERGVHSTRPYLSHYGPSSPFLTTSTIYSALLPPEVSLG